MQNFYLHFITVAFWMYSGTHGCGASLSGKKRRKRSWHVCFAWAQMWVGISSFFLISLFFSSFWALALPLENRRANARHVSFETLYGGQFTLSTQSIKPNYLADDFQSTERDRLEILSQVTSGKYRSQGTSVQREAIVRDWVFVHFEN